MNSQLGRIVDDTKLTKITNRRVADCQRKRLALRKVEKITAYLSSIGERVTY